MRNGGLKTMQVVPHENLILVLRQMFAKWDLTPVQLPSDGFLRCGRGWH